MKVIYARIIELPEEYQSRLNTILANKKPEQIAKGLCGLVETMAYQLDEKEFWSAAWTAITDAPCKTHAALRKEMAETLARDGQNLPDVVRTLYRVLGEKHDCSHKNQ